MAKEDEYQIDKVIKDSDFLIVGPNNAKAMMNYVDEAIKTGTDYLFDPAFNIIHFSKEDLANAIKSCQILIGNDYEIELIKRQLNWVDKDLFDNDRVVITTLGAKGSRVCKGQEKWEISPAKITGAIDPTGAGDAYRSGFVAGMINGYDLKTCGQMGSVASAYTVEKFGTQTHSFSLKEFSQRYGENFRDKLDLKPNVKVQISNVKT
jgi:adenosine kinase